MKMVAMCKSLGLFTFIMLSMMGNVNAQVNIKVVNYNLLNYPNVNYDDYRADTLSKIFTHYKPDLFLMQELKHPRGVDSILAKAFNTSPEDNYASGTWQWQVSAPWSSWKLQQNVIYNADLLTLIHESYLQTGTRDHNIFKFMVNDPLIESHQDTTFVYALSIHLKASQGSSNVQERLQMAQILTSYLETLEPNAYVVLGGDFNIYTHTEPAYQQFISGLNSSFVFVDPIDAPGNWHDNASFSDIHTQSTRTFQVNGDGAGGGLDDRFDFVLLSENMQEAGSRVQYLQGSYESLGNSGNCLNQYLMACTGGNVTTGIRHALWQMSDHLPVKMELEVYLPLTTSVEAGMETMVQITGANIVRERLQLHLPEGMHHGSNYEMINMMGQVLQRGRTSGPKLDIGLPSLSAGWYVLHFPDVRMKPFRFMKVD